MSDRLREALDDWEDRRYWLSSVHWEAIVAAAGRWLALTETGQRVVVRQNRLGESIIHMEGNPLADAADNLKSGTYYVIPADYLTEEETNGR